jgi:hypothetical protein
MLILIPVFEAHVLLALGACDLIDGVQSDIAFVGHALLDWGL